MTLIQLSASARGATLGTRRETAPITDPWAIFRALRDARSSYGLKPGHIQTLQALLSFLRPGQGETVFASNQEICRRIGGIDERSLRRHIDRLISLDLIARHDSPNGKRYRLRAANGDCLSFGLSLSPLLGRGAEFLAAAEAQERAQREQLFLRKQLLALLARIQALAPDLAMLTEMPKILRRKLDEAAYHSLIGAATEALHSLSTAVDVVVTTDMSANDGQNVRHQSRSEKEDKDLEQAAPNDTPPLGLLTAVCREAATFANEPLRSWSDVQRHAQKLAPMMGIRPETFAAASAEAGQAKAAAAVFIALQFGTRIRNLAAYFHSLTLGRRAGDFHPTQLLQRLSRHQAGPA